MSMIYTNERLFLIQKLQSKYSGRLEIKGADDKYVKTSSKYDPLWLEIKNAIKPVAQQVSPSSYHSKSNKIYYEGSVSTLLNLFCDEAKLNYSDSIINGYYFYLFGMTRAAYLAQNPQKEAEWKNEAKVISQDNEAEKVENNVNLDENKIENALHETDSPDSKAEKNPIFEAASNPPNEQQQAENRPFYFWKSFTLGLVSALIFTFCVLICLYFAFWDKVQSANSPQILYMTTCWIANSAMAKKARDFADAVEKGTNHKVKIVVLYDFQLPDNELNNSDATKAYKALKQGKIDMMYSSTYYNADQPASIFFSSIAGGMNHTQMNEWLGTNFKENDAHEWKEGYRLWRKIHGDSLLVYPAGNTGVQWGGFFKQRIHSLADFKGKKVRVGGGFVKLLLKSLETEVELVYERDILKLMAKGELDWVEFMNPSEDYKIGMHLFPNTYTYIEEEGWHGPNSVLELLINKESFAQLSPEIREVFYQKLPIFDKLEGEMKDNDGENKKEMTQNHQIWRFPDSLKMVLYKKQGQIIEKYVAEHKAKTPLVDSVYRSYKRHCANCNVFK